MASGDSMLMTPASVAELIDAFDGVTAFSRIIKKGVSTASEMKRSGSIDVKYWPDIIAAAPEHDIEVTSETLMAMHTKSAVSVQPQEAGAAQ
jgi:hypothetical protein